jgi:hypothetical protein
MNTDAEERRGGSASFILFNLLPSTAVSFVMHMIIVIVMAFMVIEPPTTVNRTELVASADTDVEELEDFKEEIVPEMNLDENAPVTNDPSVVYTPAQQNVIADPVVVTDVVVDPTPDSAVAQVELMDFGSDTAPKTVMTKEIGSTAGTGLSGRGAAAAGKFNIQKAGGTTESEKAVAMALKWLVDHQNPDGSWNFDHTTGVCNRRCSHGGKLVNCTTGATAMALLPLLGAGQTHKEGKYKVPVERGLYYLAGRMKVKNNMGDLAEGTMYAHGIAAIVLCEAYAMTHDKGLLAPAQLSLNYTMYAQDPVGGGWRYSARQPGDTSAVGWQLMALKSGHMAYLQVNPNTIKGATRFLDSVQGDSGATYGYTDPGNGPATSAIGLLSRMYLGWKKDNPALQRGVDLIAKRGPTKGHFYYNYYATQVMRHAGGEKWDVWNEKMRDSLVADQDKKDHAAGSWHQGGDHGAESGGRLYCTSLATMILEVYYRHMPIYKTQSTDEDFPL